jgi:hypothetical protein
MKAARASMRLKIQALALFKRIRARATRMMKKRKKMAMAKWML